MKDDTQLARWLAGDMNADELDAFQKSPEYASYERIKTNFTKLESPQFNPDHILQRVLRQEKPRATTVPLYKKVWFRAAAAILLLLGMGLAFTMITTSETATYGNTYAFSLPDTSEVLLNAGSEAHYHKWNWSNNRVIALDGEAYFKVAKGNKFTVKTSLGTVTVLGTQFNVRARGNRFTVVCYEGKVRVEYEKVQTILTPNQQISFHEGSSSGIVETKVSYPEWTHGELHFSKETFAEIVSELERTYDVSINTTAAPTQLFSGSVPGHDLNAALDILCAAYHLKATKNAKHITLTRIDENP